MWMMRLRRNFEALKLVVIAGLTSTVARQAINGCISLVPNIWSSCKNDIAVSTETLLVTLRRHSGAAPQVTRVSARPGI
jgi:hypothetical protein